MADAKNKLPMFDSKMWIYLCLRSPSSLPSPQGEGETLAASLQILATDLRKGNGSGSSPSQKFRHTFEIGEDAGEAGEVGSGVFAGDDETECAVRGGTIFQ